MTKLLSSGELSGFLASPGLPNLGGKYVQELEKKWSEFVGVPYSVTFNSWTSGLEASVAALELEPGSEVIVTPWTMSATVAAIVNNNLVPVFADIDSFSFNISIDFVKSLINQKTSAIMAVDIFGKPCDFKSLSELARNKNLRLIIDCAQAPGASYMNRKSAEFADIAGYSFNRHKHLQCGEGGIAVTNNPKYLEKLRLFRNHSEVSSIDITNKIRGHNMRFGEIESVLILGQIKRADELLNHRREAAKKLIYALSDFEHIKTPELLENEIQDFYIVGLILDKVASRYRNELVDDLTKKGFPGALKGYVNAHKLPQYLPYTREKLEIAEDLHNSTFFGIYMCGVTWTDNLIEKYAASIKQTLSRIIYGS